MSKPAQTVERPPIVAVLGHVDHGKSTLLDFIRKANVVAGEAGGITQHVAAYEVEREKNGEKKRITFIDTPGHAAFSAIRARGASAADIAILVVAADDGVKAQTLEALKSIRDAKTPFIVAINKIDKPNADQERTIRTLLDEGVYLEKYGGEIPWAAISAKVGTGVEELLDLILLVAEIEGFTGDASVPAHGYVIEAHRDQKRGLAATLIIRDGTVRSGMAVLAGRAIAPVRIMESTAGKTLREATFSTPVQLIGFDELPQVGEEFHAYKNKREAEAARPAPIAGKTSIPSQEPLAEGEVGPFSMPVIIRADASGSLEAIEQEVPKLGTEYKRVRVVQSGIGTVSENDVKAAIASDVPAVVIGFNVGVDAPAAALALQHGIRIETFTIIYKLTERLEELLEESAPKRRVEMVTGKAKVLKQFGSRKDERVVGGKVSEGFLERGSLVRVMRRAEEVGVGKVKNIQSNKQDVSRIEEGREFGAQINASFEILQGDTLEGFNTSME
ncbi:translation initiation factor IF-2 [Candidatus Kaiserbacteria bacterium RIFCSPHIGHO2_02_FULL_54_11b]|uniref:Translation initiation factor IF-2 n=2 Tax=Candidatus Kaiseribacteriota TaxID=1752734 RepID=A0A1F6CSA2_9BACT|nr:MAG: translation initiation factor IF-2 [Candidatus Kaiserbacteria bacterium RIFCSPHIGHO2_01_FULL_54_36b]OGG64910.1 MAG: translation initiation factor IF-2 [Candidatus Kaiserbacteria bacterium RIFCSPHIGHO2_02_FULL_54_11b]